MIIITFSILLFTSLHDRLMFQLCSYHASLSTICFVPLLLIIATEAEKTQHNTADITNTVFRDNIQSWIQNHVVFF